MNKRAPLEIDHLTQRQLDRLLEYSTTVPSGTEIGKKWKARRKRTWYTGEYVPHPTPGLTGIRWRKVKIRKVGQRRIREENR